MLSEFLSLSVFGICEVRHIVMLCISVVLIYSLYKLFKLISENI